MHTKFGGTRAIAALALCGVGLAGGAASAVAARTHKCTDHYGFGAVGVQGPVKATGLSCSAARKVVKSISSDPGNGPYHVAGQTWRCKVGDSYGGTQTDYNCTSGSERVVWTFGQ